MDTVKFLGASGGRDAKHFSTCIQVAENIVIDAGNIVNALGSSAKDIDHIFLTHAHLDHIIDIAFLIDNFFASRENELCIYGLKDTLSSLKEHIFNWQIWPDFSELYLIKENKKSVKFIPIKYNQTYTINGVSLTPFKSNHTITCCGYVVEKNSNALLFSSDTYKNKKIWDIVNENQKIKSLVIDVSFPSKFEHIAHKSKHLTPKLLKMELKKLHRNDVQIYVNHIKPSYENIVIEELEKMGISQKNILRGGEELELESGKVISYEEPTIDYTEQIKKLNQIGIALSAQNNLEELLEMIVKEARHLAGADGGTLYMLDEKNHKLNFTVAQTKSLNIYMGGRGDKISWPPLPLYLENSQPNTQMVAALCALEDKVINIPDVYEAKGFCFDGTKNFDKNTGYRSKSMLVVPLKNHKKKIIGVLQLINKTDNTTKTIGAFNQDDEDLTLSLGSQAAIAITNAHLIADLENLLEAFLKSIIYAIGQKSPYTAGHIQRMVELSVMMSEAINQDENTFKDKKFSSEQIKQINFAALMHDIGKLATPEQVVDKKTKLETIFDRINLVEAQAKIIKKEAYIEFLEAKIEDIHNEKEIEKAEKIYKEKMAIVDEALELIRSSNKGAEFFPNEKVDRITKILREPIVVKGKEFYLIDADEALNLSVQKGTLTDEQRAIINKHADISVSILNKLPFPEKFARIPEISGSHHEKINGKGYPLGLSGDEISFEARILAIADVFEALTASDRPYKEANKLSTAMKILYFMAKDGELDKELVRFFYTSGLYLKYAEKWLKRENIDEVTVDFNSL
ncbi:MAG: GAF domain-containing protein [Sulfurospirillaceae bacterium]|nr:GAF domain-containing protein [Sulfurospirillaceae bacterium]